MPSLRGVDKFFTKRKRTFGGNEKDPKNFMQAVQK